MIQITFTLTAAELIGLTRTKQLRWLKPIYWIAGIAFVLMLIAGFITHQWGGLLAFGLPMVLTIAIFEWRFPKNIERQLNELPSWGKPVTFKFTDDHIQQKTADVDSTVEWQHFIKAEELPDWFLLHLGPRSLFWSIPKRAFESAEQMEDFRKLLRLKQLL